MGTAARAESVPLWNSLDRMGPFIELDDKRGRFGILLEQYEFNVKDFIPAEDGQNAETP